MSKSYSDLSTPSFMLVFQVIVLLCMFLACSDLRNFRSIHTLSYISFNIFSFLVYFFASQSSPGFVTIQDLISQGKSLGFKASDERSVSFEIEAVKNQRQLIIKKQDKQLEPPVMSSEVSPHVVNTNRSDHEEEKENTQNHIEVSNVDDIQIVEIRHCMICKIDQPIRTKHCRDCGRCVATQDHHCPWLGVCIGEKNKKSFYFYLVIQMIQLLWTFLLVMIKKDLKSIDNPGSVFRWFLVNWLNLSLAVLLAIFIVMVGGLIGFHLYLASINLTTWEFLSWNKISYLKGLDKRLGSPFSNGIVSNLYNNCCRRIPKYFIVWEVTRGK